MQGRALSRPTSTPSLATGDHASSGTQARILRNITYLLGRQAFTWTLSMALVAFVPHYLGDAGLGRITFATSVVAILLIFTDAGTNTLLTMQLALHPGLMSYLLWNAYALRLTLGLAMGALLVLALSGLEVDGDLRFVFYASAATLVVMWTGRRWRPSTAWS